ncbi:MAG: NlpC/P60 family protein [Bacteroidota bacterium]
MPHRSRSRRFVRAGGVARRALATLAGLITLCTLVGCGSTRTVADAPASPEALAWEVSLRTLVQEWTGVPYQLGGHGRAGIDCSAFTALALSATMGLALPRTTAAQVREGIEVSRSSLQAGDLVFFKTGRHTRHVGVYLRGGEFAHASTSQGVTISGLDEAYWADRFWTARRLAGPGRAPSPKPQGRRSGW